MPGLSLLFPVSCQVWLRFFLEKGCVNRLLCKQSNQGSSFASGLFSHLDGGQGRGAHVPESADGAGASPSPLPYLLAAVTAPAGSSGLRVPPLPSWTETLQREAAGRKTRHPPPAGMSLPKSWSANRLHGIAVSSPHHACSGYRQTRGSQQRLLPAQPQPCSCLSAHAWGMFCSEAP